MRKSLTMICILVFALLLTACGTSAPTPTDVDNKVGEKITTDNSQQEDQVQENESTSSEKENNENENDTVTNASKKTADKSVVSQTESGQNGSAAGDRVSNDIPVFSSNVALRNWLLSNDNTQQFAEDKNTFLSVMATGNQIVYYQPALGDGNSLLQLDQVEVSNGVLYYDYRFVDETYANLQLRICCFMDDTQKDFYNEIKADVQKQVNGRVLANYNNHDIIYYDNQSNATVFCWPQYGGYIVAFLEGKNHADKVQDVLPYLNLAQVTIRTDVVTQ